MAFPAMYIFHIPHMAFPTVSIFHIPHMAFPTVSIFHITRTTFPIFHTINSIKIVSSTPQLPCPSFMRGFRGFLFAAIPS